MYYKKIRRKAAYALLNAVICFFCLCRGAAAEVVSAAAVDARGKWQTGKIGNREVIISEQPGIRGYIEMEVPQEGRYQLFVSLFHGWRNYCLVLFVDAVDAGGRRFRGDIFSEPRWYLGENSGRWEFRSPSAFPYWELSRGKLKITFWPGAKMSAWEDETAPFEDKAAIHAFFLCPIDADNKSGYRRLREQEACYGPEVLLTH